MTSMLIASAGPGFKTIGAARHMDLFDPNVRALSYDARGYSDERKETSMRKGGRRVAPIARMVASIVTLVSIAGLNTRPSMAQDSTSGRSATRCQGEDNGGLTLSPGFCASIFADNLGHVRHLVVAPDGEVYANTWSGRYFPNSPPPPGGFLLALKDTKGTGRADVIERFGVTVEEGGTGGSGIALYDGGLYADENDRILRYELVPGSLPSNPSRVVVSGLPLTGDHPMHPFVIDASGDLAGERAPVQRSPGTKMQRTNI